MNGTREEHIKWAKQRALEFLDGEHPDIAGALASLTSDLNKHDQTRGHVAATLGMAQFAGGFITTVEQMAHFIDGVQ